MPTYFESWLYHRIFSSGVLKAAIQLVMGQPITKAVSAGRVLSITSETQSVTHMSERRSCSLRLYVLCCDLETMSKAHESTCVYILEPTSKGPSHWKPWT